jgi:hypothetical protein
MNAGSEFFVSWIGYRYIKLRSDKSGYPCFTDQPGYANTGFEGYAFAEVHR